MQSGGMGKGLLIESDESYAVSSESVCQDSARGSLLCTARSYASHEVDCQPPRVY